MNDETNLSPASPWREPMVWLTIAIPALTVVAGFVTLWLAMSHPDIATGPTVIEQIAKPDVRAP